MTGGENQPGSWVLKTERLGPAKARTFDSYEPFPFTAASFPGDGINAKVTLNGKQVWPATGWQYVANATVTVPFAFNVDVVVGDKLAFVVNMNGNIGWDTTAFDPTIRYPDGEKHVASQEFGEKQGQSGWRYQYIEGDRFVDLVYYPVPKQWRKEKDNATGTPFVGVGDQHPDAGQDAARVWTAPRAGRVRISGSVCNTGNGSGQGGGYGFRMGTSTYAPWCALFARDSHEGLVFGWDYFGHWASSVRESAQGTVSVHLKVAGHKQTLAPVNRSRRPRALSACSTVIWMRRAMKCSIGSTATSGTIRATSGFPPSACSASGTTGPLGGSRAWVGPAAARISPAPSARSFAWRT